jgi:hypothetical protein
MSTSVTLIPGTGATVLDAGREIVRGFKLAERWQKQGKRREAEEVYGGILTIEPKHLGSLCPLGAVYQQHGRRKETVAPFRRAAAIHAHAFGRWRRRTCKREPLPEAIEIAVAKAGARSRPMASNHA